MFFRQNLDNKLVVARIGWRRWRETNISADNVIKLHHFFEE